MPTRKTGDDDGNVVPIRRERTPAQDRAAKRGNAAAVAAQKARGAKRAKAREDGTDGPSRWELYRAGKLPVAEWDLEELGRMQLRNFHGLFGGRPPTLNAQQVREVQAEIVRRGGQKFNEYGAKAIEVMYKLMVDETVEPAIRLRAAERFIERCYGKVPDVVKATVVSAWQEDIDAVMAVMEDGETA
jgi:hypothetical protein